MRKIARLALRTAVISSVAALCLVPQVRAEEWTRSFPISGRAQVRVETNDSSVQVLTGDSKQVEFRVTYAGYELNKTLHIDAAQDGDSVRLNAQVSGHWGININWGGKGHRVRIEVRMPKDADVQVDTGDGSVETEAINGRLRVHTGDGSVHSQAATGDVDLDSGDGSITLEGAKGNIRLHSGDGSIEARNLDGRVDASSGDGHIRLDGRLDQLNVKTGDGSVNARIQPGSKIVASWTIHTGDGSVDITLPADLQANIEASTNDGHISLGIPVTVEGTFSNSQIHGKMNGGGQPLTIHTGDGSIRLGKG